MIQYARSSYYYNYYILIQDAIRYENGREIVGSAIIVEWTKGNPRRSGPPPRDSRSRVSHCGFIMLSPDEEIIQPCNYQLSKSIVQEIKFGDIAVIQILTICHIVTGILILIEMFKRGKPMDMILV